MRTIVLASTSPFRKSLLEKLNIPFVCAKPDVDETALSGESPVALVARLAVDKAQAVAPQFNDALIIGSDQVAVCDDMVLGKPHHYENAVKQLRQFSGKAVTFYTGLCVYDSRIDNTIVHVEPFIVHFNALSEQDISHYLRAEQPYNCAGSFKSEGLGICLFDRFEGNDPNSLIGLPLIQLVNLLKRHHFDVLAEQPAIE